MNQYNADEYTFEALCLHNVSAEIKTLVYLVGLIDSEKHLAADPQAARYKVLYPMSHCEEQVESPGELLGIQKELLPPNYLPQTPLMAALRWSPITAMLEKGYQPVRLARHTTDAPHAVASGIWEPGIVDCTKAIQNCTTDAELFWAIMKEAFERSRSRGWLVNIIAEVGWRYERKINSLASWSERQIAKSGRILWKCTPQG